MAQGTPVTPGHLARVRRAVARYGASELRDLPWRRTRDPWAVLVSEVMLQQTGAARVAGPFERFVARFPSPETCARADQAEVVRLWEGLGYNRRAVRLHRAAGQLLSVHQGAVPDTFEALQELPGVGPSTARAVLAICFGVPLGALDVNVARLVTRAVAGRPLARAQAQAIADALVPPRGVWEFTQALFDIGAAYCTARDPGCPRCPLRRSCAWQAQGGRGDPAAPPAGTARRQGPFEGSDRQGRGRLVAALRSGPVPADRLAGAAGWPSDPARAHRVLSDLVAEGMVTVDHQEVARLA